MTEFRQPEPTPLDAASVDELDERTQRGLVLRAVRMIAADQLPAYRAEQPSLGQLDSKIRDNVWGMVLFFWTVIGPVAAGWEISVIVRVRSAVRRQWREWLRNPDPETELWLVEGDIRRMVARLPWRQWREKRAIMRELKRVTRYWESFQQKLEVVRSQLRASAPHALDPQREELARKLAAETDALTAESLRRQLAAVEGERDAHAALEAWGRRLEAAREECGLSLRHLRARLSLRTAGGDLRDVPVLQEAAVELQSINSQLAAADAAAEEVLQLRHG